MTDEIKTIDLTNKSNEECRDEIYKLSESGVEHLKVIGKAPEDMSSLFEYCDFQNIDASVVYLLIVKALNHLISLTGTLVM